MTEVRLICEGLSDTPVLKRVFAYLNLPAPIVDVSGGKTRILDNLIKYNLAARYSGLNWVVVLDLDREAETAEAYVQRLVPDKADGLVLGVAVQAVESWLLGDSENLGQYLGVTQNRFPTEPDREPDPKQVLFQIVRRSNKRRLRQDMLPPQDGTAKVGPGYVNRVAEFVYHESTPWRPEIAQVQSPSLATFIRLLQEALIE